MALWRRGSECSLEFSPEVNTWTWVSGSDTDGALGVYGTQGTVSASNVPGSRFGAVSWIDGSGNLWLAGGVVWTPPGRRLTSMTSGPTSPNSRVPASGIT
jgi:hypothetical protein